MSPESPSETSPAPALHEAGDRGFDKREQRFRKRFRPEERAARDHEAAALTQAAGPLVPPLLGVGEDEDGPWLELADCGDTDLRQLVATSGPLPSDAVLELARACARALAALHARGVTHGDVKPANFLLDAHNTLGLVDFENASWRDGEQLHHAEREGFTGGTHGYAPIEARLGHVPGPAFDVFGFGATLHFLFAGVRPALHADGSFDGSCLARLRPTLDPGMRALVERCLAKDATSRPGADEIVDALANLRPPTRLDLELELALLEGRPVDFELAGPIEEILLRRTHWAGRLDGILARIPSTEMEDPLDHRLEAAERFSAAAHCVLRFVPLLPRLRERLSRAQIKLPRLLTALPGEAKRLLATGQLETASELAERAIRLAQRVAEIPLERRDAAQLLTGVLRAAHSVRRHVQAEEPRQRELWAQLEAAEARLDLRAARDKLQQLQERYSGTTPLTAAARDRLHRLFWLLERLASAREAVQRARAILPESEGNALFALFDRVEHALDHESGEIAQSSLDVLGRVLTELLESHPALPLQEARRELKSLRLQLSRRAREILDRIEERLSRDPVPIRLLTQDLEEVDRILLLGGLVDTSEVDRSTLLDRLERLRLRIEEISEQGRRLVQGARDQFEHGRLTTALYDLERALRASQSDDGSPAESGEELGIREELERVRRLREEVQTATRRNRELAEMHHRFAAQGQETLSARQRLLEDRAEVLGFLIEKGSRAFAPRYREELLELRLTMARERAERGELDYLHEQDPGAQMQIAQELLSVLEHTRVELDIPADGPLATIEERWRGYYARADRDARGARQAADRARLQRIRRRLWAAAALAVSAIAGLLAWWL